jgi:hypothetical protein
MDDDIADRLPGPYATTEALAADLSEALNASSERSATGLSAWSADGSADDTIVYVTRWYRRTDYAERSLTPRAAASLLDRIVKVWAERCDGDLCARYGHGECRNTSAVERLVDDAVEASKAEWAAAVAERAA